MNIEKMNKVKKKLVDEFNAFKDKDFAKPLFRYILDRCKEDEGLCDDLLQEHKTFEKCNSYIFEKAKEKAKGKSSIAIDNETVFEWAEDYYRKDDKAEEEKKAREEEERKKKLEESKKKAAEKKKKEKAEKAAKKQKEKDEKTGQASFNFEGGE